MNSADPGVQRQSGGLDDAAKNDLRAAAAAHPLDLGAVRPTGCRLVFAGLARLVLGAAVLSVLPQRVQRRRWELSSRLEALQARRGPNSLLPVSGAA